LSEANNNRKGVKDYFNILGSKILPHSIDSEMVILGSMIQDKLAINKAQELLSEDYFYNENNKLIFRTIISMSRTAQQVDIISLSEELKKQGYLNQVGGNLYLANLVDMAPTTENIETHSRIIQEKYLKRQLINISGQILSRSYDDTTDALEEIDVAENKIFQLAQQRFQKGYEKIDKVANDAIDLIQSMIHRDNKGLSGIPSGYSDLDINYTGGFQNSDLIIIAARPSMGKTAFALSMARNISVEHKIPVAFFSIEMSSIQLVLRLIAAESKTSSNNLRTGKISQKEFIRIVKSMDRLKSAPIYIDDSPMLSVLELRAKARRLVNEGVRIIFVDYLQLMKSPKAESREREISIISQSLKQLAKELNIPVIALAQLNRSIESRNDKRPMLSDLRESGSIEQDADVVMFIHRPDKYPSKKEKKQEIQNSDTDVKIAEIIIGKQRNGPTGTLKLAFHEKFTRFENLQDYGYQEPPGTEFYGADLPDLGDDDNESF